MLDTSSIIGGAAFLGGCAALLYGGTVAAVVAEALRPERRNLGWALARGLPSEPTCWGLPAREWRFEWRGASCPVWEIGDDDPAATTAIVVHGFSRSRYDALARLGPLLPHARRFLLPDLPGHGESSGRGTRLGADEGEYLTALASAHTRGELILVGHSLGATIAIKAASSADIASRVRAVIALAPYERLRTPIGARLDLRGMPRLPLVAPVVRALGVLGATERSTRGDAARVSCPLAVLAGEVDPVTPLSEAKAIAAAAKQSRLAVIAHARHDDFHTLGRDEVSAAAAWALHGDFTSQEQASSGRPSRSPSEST
jgi:pimeloyl-ACP methyl ester carboxylesterase